MDGRGGGGLGGGEAGECDSICLVMRLRLSKRRQEMADMALVVHVNHMHFEILAAWEAVWGSIFEKHAFVVPVRQVRDNAQAAHSHGAAGDHFDEETSFHDDYGLPPGTFSRECADATSIGAPIVCPFESRLGVAGFWAYRSWLWGYKHLPLLREFRDVSHIGVVHDDCVLMFKPVLQVSTSI